jgi:hypothetical protein
MQNKPDAQASAFDCQTPFAEMHLLAPRAGARYLHEQQARMQNKPDAQASAFDCQTPFAEMHLLAPRAGARRGLAFAGPALASTMTHDG